MAQLLYLLDQVNEASKELSNSAHKLHAMSNYSNSGGSSVTDLFDPLLSTVGPAVTTTKKPFLDAQTHDALYWFSISYATVGLAGILLNTLSIAVFVVNPQLRRWGMAIIWYQMFNGFLQGIGHFAWGLSNVTRNFEPIAQLSCMAQLLFVMMPDILLSSFSLALALQRFYAIQWPMSYRTSNHMFEKVACASIGVLHMGMNIVYFTDQSLDRVLPLCNGVQTQTAWFHRFTSEITFWLAFGTFVVYIVCMVLAHCKKNVVVAVTNKNLAAQLQDKFMKLGRVLLIWYSFSHLPAGIIGYFRDFMFTGFTSTVIGMMTSQLMVCDSVVNVCICIWKLSEFRATVCDIMGKLMVCVCGESTKTGSKASGLSPGHMMVMMSSRTSNEATTKS